MMKVLLIAGLAVLAVRSVASPLPANSPWLTDNTYLQATQTGNRIVAVGDRGAVIYSDDQGGHWEQAKSGTNVLLTGVCFSDANHGWAVGHDAVVEATTDAGKNWTVQYSDPLNGTPIGHLDTDQDNSASPAGDADALPVDTSGAPLLSVWCDPVDAQHVIAVGGFGYFLETHDGGAQWHKEMSKLNNPDGLHLYDIASVPNDSGAVFITGEKGSVFLSVNAGGSWSKLHSPYAGTFFGVTSSGPGNVLVYGLEGNLWLTHDYGKSWSKVDSQTRSGINGGTVTADGSVLLVGNDGILLESHDRGATFNKRVVEQRATLSSVLPLDNNKMLLTGVNGIRVMKQE